MVDGGGVLYTFRALCTQFGHGIHIARVFIRAYYFTARYQAAFDDIERGYSLVFPVRTPIVGLLLDVGFTRRCSSRVEARLVLFLLFHGVDFVAILAGYLPSSVLPDCSPLESVRLEHAIVHYLLLCII